MGSPQAIEPSNHLRGLIVLAACALALVGCVWAVWGQTGGFEYIRLDDNDYTFDCPFVVGGLSWANVKAAFCTFTHGGIWMPLTSISYMADISLFGGGPRAHHLMGVAWHCVNAVLFFWLLARVCGAMRGGRDARPGLGGVMACFAAAAFWAVHPLRNESVAWIASRKDLVFAFWTLLGLHAWISGGAGWRGAAWTLAGWACCAMACMGKPTGMVFPLVAFVVEWAAARTDAQGRVPPETRRMRVSPGMLSRYAGPVAMAVVTAAIAVHSQTNAEGMEARGLYEGYGSLAWRCLNAAVALGLYIAQTVVPVKVHIMYRPVVGGVPHGAFVGLAVLCAAAAGVCVLSGRVFGGGRRPRRAGDVDGQGARFRGRVALAGVLWFLAAVAPTLGIAGGFGDQARADRFLYLPAMGLSLALMAAMAGRGGRAGRVVLPAASAVLLCVYGAAAWANASTYETDYSVFANVLRHDPEHPLALAHVGTELCARMGRPDEGIECYRRALKCENPSEDTAAQLAYSLAVRNGPGDAQEIVNLCSNLVERPELDVRGMATEALGIVAMRGGGWRDAARFLDASIRAEQRKMEPDEAMVRLAICRYRLGEKDKAEALLKPLAMRSGNKKVRDKARALLQALWRERM